MTAEIRLLGPTTVVTSWGEQVAPSAWRTTKTFDLMRLLALAGHPVPVPTLLDAFWPASDPAHAGTSLRTATSQIRRVLGPDSVVRAGNGLALDAHVDVADFRALAARADAARVAGCAEQVVALVEEAEALYAGDLDVSGTECPWLHETQRELAAMRVHLLLEAAEAAVRHADWHRALDFAQRASTVERSDRATRAAMRAWFGLGEAGKPVEEFELLRAHLTEEYGVDPAPETRALYLELINSVWEEWPPREMVVGRQHEVRAAVHAALAWMMEDEASGGVVWVVGRKGSGRESVAHEAVRTIGPLADGSCGPRMGPSTEVLPDQGALSRATAEMLRRRAHATGRILFAPATEVAPGDTGCREAVVEVAALDPADFRRLMALVLQGRPATRLVDELYAESHGLPGLACRAARRRMSEGELTWGPDGVVDRAPDVPRRSRLVAALAAWPVALLGMFGGEGILEPTVRVATIVEERTKQAAAVARALPPRPTAATLPAWLALA